MERVILVLAFALTLLLPRPLFAWPADCDHPIGPQATGPTAAYERDGCRDRQGIARTAPRLVLRGPMPPLGMSTDG